MYLVLTKTDTLHCWYHHERLLEVSFVLPFLPVCNLFETVRTLFMFHSFSVYWIWWQHCKHMKHHDSLLSLEVKTCCHSPFVYILQNVNCQDFYAVEFVICIPGLENQWAPTEILAGTGDYRFSVLMSEAT